MYRIAHIETLAPGIQKFDVVAQGISQKAQPGQFVMIKI